MIQNYNLPDCLTSNTFEGVEFILPTSDLWNLYYAYAKIQIRQSAGGPVVHEFHPGNGSLIITQPHTITIPPQKIDIRPGTYFWDLRIRFVDHRTKTFIGGKWTILPIITRI